MIDLIKAIAKRLKEQYGAKEVILFGSYAKGNPREDSDIDLLIISDSKERFFERQATVRRLLRDLKKRIPVSPIVLTPAEIQERKKHEDQFINEILKTGIRA
ncbi:MAG: nucleotidyltransferase domain-containing protein [Deltaproteobacteria bacterium]|nr:nucleotidyltransferase domain-containing protein [Deltaproteobacteria bacterium]